MRSIVMCTLVATVAVAVPAQAKPGAEPRPEKAAKPAKAAKAAAAKSCTPRAVGYNARGILVSQALIQTAGRDTAERGDDRYSGELTVDVVKANHRAAKGEQTYTVTDARVRFADANHDDVADVPALGDRVKVHGKITRLAKKCDQAGFTPTVTVRNVKFKAPKSAEPAEAPKPAATPGA